MLKNEIEIQICLSDLSLKETELQTVISKSLLPEISRLDGVKKADLIPSENAPPGAKNLGGYLLGKFQLLVNLKNLKAVLTWLSKNLTHQSFEISAKKSGDSTEILVKAKNHDVDIQEILRQIDDYMNNDK